MSKRKSKMGRPSLGADAKIVVVSLRLSANELRALRAAAKAAGRTVTAHIMRPHREKG